MEEISCKEMGQELVAFVEGEMDEQKVSAFKAHLDHCEFCQELMTSYLKTIFILKQLNKIEPPPDLVERLREYVLRKLDLKNG